MKMYLIHNEHDKLEHELDSIFHSDEVMQVRACIQMQLDPCNKGYVELEDLTQAIEDRISERHVAVRLNSLIGDHLEYKNTDSVFYSPLLGLPAPYFRYAGHIELFSVVFKMS